VKLIAGIGNPSPEYKATRHNAGFMAVDRISSASGIRLGRRKHSALFGRGAYCGEDVLLVKPLTFVNLSGRAVKSFLKYYPLSEEDMLVIHDDMDIPLGRLKLKSGGSSAGHRGVESVIREIGTPDFARLRIGISSADLKSRGVDFVLGRFSPSEKKLLDEALADCVKAVEEFLLRGMGPAMNRFN
jgi:peptidyl-tRNA hydrolase, PTH1 family